MVFHENIFLFSTSLSENQNDIIVLPTPSPDPLLLPELIPHHAPPTQATPILTLSDLPSTFPYHSHMAIDDALSFSLDVSELSPPPITPHLPFIPSSPSMDIHPPPIHQSTCPTKNPSHFKDYQAQYVALLAFGALSPITSSTRYPITQYVTPHRNFINNIS